MTCSPGRRTPSRTRTGKASASITRLIKAYQEELISLDELRERMPPLRARETNLRSQLDAVAAQLVDREAYLKLAENLAGYLTRLDSNAATATVPERQRVLRLLVKNVLIGPERITIQHSIPTGGTATPHPNPTDRDDDEEPAPSSSLRWRSPIPAAGQHRADRARRARDGAVAARRADVHLG
jgi:site-specific DNA recombinase